MDQSVATFAMHGRPWRTSHRPRRPLGIKLVVSLWLHLTLLALLLVTVRYQRLQEELPPPATVALVFEGGQPQGPAVPEPRPPVALPAEPPAPPLALPPALPSAVPPALPPTPQPTAPPQVALLPPPPLPPAVVQPPLPTPPIPPALLQPAPPPPVPLAPDQPRPDSMPPRPPPPVAVQPPRPTAPAPRPQPSPPVVAPRPTAPNGFPTPMDFSFNRTPAAPSRDTPRPPSRTGSRSPSTLDFTLAPREGATDNTPFSRLAGMRMGPDWRNELSAWVRKHAYYPPQAAMNGEDGSAMVQVVVQPNGHVTSVELERKSGSKWLDIALVALFRDADLPPLHGETEPLTFHFTMNYILIRVQ